jgi:hypothetical protein
MYRDKIGRMEGAVALFARREIESLVGIVA